MVDNALTAPKTAIDNAPELVTIYFSGVALIAEVVLLGTLLLGRSEAVTNCLKTARFSLGWSNNLFRCLVGQIICVLFFHVLNILGYTTNPASYMAELRCTISYRLVAFFYVFQCFFLYLFLMYRVQTTMIVHTKFTNYLDKFLKLLTFGVIPALMVLALGLFSGGFMQNNGKQVCVMYATPAWSIILVILDTVLNAGFLLLFIIPIRQLITASVNQPGVVQSSNEHDRRSNLMQVAKRNLLATIVCVVISIVAMIAMLYESYAQTVAAKIIGCMPCVVASITNTFLMLITTKGAWKKESGGDSALNSKGRSGNQLVKSGSMTGLEVKNTAVTATERSVNLA